MSNDFKSLSDKVKPREQLRDAVSPAELKPEALLAIMLKTGTAGCNVVELSRRLLSAFDSVTEMIKSDWRTLAGRIKEHNAAHPEKPIKGLGPVKIMELAAAFELVRRGYEIGGEDIRKIRVKTPEDAYRIFKEAALLGDEQENFLVIPLDAKAHPLVTTPLRVVRGTSNGAPVHVREVFKSAIRWAAQSIVVAHNHPSGDPTPSKDDICLTEQLIEASRIIGITIADHLIIGDSGISNGRGYVSLRREGHVSFRGGKRGDVCWG